MGMVNRTKRLSAGRSGQIGHLSGYHKEGLMYRAKFETYGTKQTIRVVGCGGTGGFVAEGLARLLPPEWEIDLQDFDRVEERNLLRQNFFAQDLGRFKSEALAERLSNNYRRAIGYYVIPYSDDAHEFGRSGDIIIGCVDNAAARRAISKSSTGWWIDAGNDQYSGQVLIGNSNEIRKDSYSENSKLARDVLKPHLQLPSILDPSSNTPVRIDCATAVQREEQSPVINQMMATLVLNSVDALINHRLTWQAQYVDLESGTLSTILIKEK